MKIAKHTVVSLRYVMKNDQGEMLETTMDKLPVDYVHGSGKIIPMLEGYLEGMECGQQKSFSLAADPDSGLGEKIHFDIVIDQVRSATPQESASGEPDKACGPGCRC